MTSPLFVCCILISLVSLSAAWELLDFPANFPQCVETSKDPVYQPVNLNSTSSLEFQPFFGLDPTYSLFSTIVPSDAHSVTFKVFPKRLYSYYGSYYYYAPAAIWAFSCNGIDTMSNYEAENTTQMYSDPSPSAYEAGNFFVSLEVKTKNVTELILEVGVWADYYIEACTKYHHFSTCQSFCGDDDCGTGLELCNMTTQECEWNTGYSSSSSSTGYPYPYPDSSSHDQNGHDSYSTLDFAVHAMFFLTLLTVFGLAVWLCAYFCCCRKRNLNVPANAPFAASAMPPQPAYQPHFGYPSNVAYGTFNHAGQPVIYYQLPADPRMFQQPPACQPTEDVKASKQTEDVMSAM